MEAVARELFDSKVTMVVLNQSEEDERTGKKEHVVFLVKQTNQAGKPTDQVVPSQRGVSVRGWMMWSVSVCTGYTVSFLILCFSTIFL